MYAHILSPLFQLLYIFFSFFSCSTNFECRRVFHVSVRSYSHNSPSVLFIGFIWILALFSLCRMLQVKWNEWKKITDTRCAPDQTRISVISIQNEIKNWEGFSIFVSCWISYYSTFQHNEWWKKNESELFHRFRYFNRSFFSRFIRALSNYVHFFFVNPEYIRW